MRSAALEAYSEVWTTCLEIGKMGVTPLLEDDGEDVEPHFVCFAAMRGNLGFFDGDRTHGPKDLGINAPAHPGILAPPCLGMPDSGLQIP